jgi:serine/threonine protein kinase
MSDDVADLPDGTLVAGKLRIVRALGIGGMGTVYEVEHELTRHRRALKLLHPEFASNQQAVTRFLREASAAGRIANEHVVETFDAGVLDTGEPYLVMELLQGRSLADLLEATGRISEREAIDWLAQACDGLQAAHDAGIVHRDIKPDNLFVLSSGRVKILDFGISKFDPRLTGERQLTGDLTLGTPYYMAPEQTSKSGSVDHRADIYALGVVLYECVTGSRPFEAETYPQLIVRIHLGDYAAASSISPTAALLDHIIAKAMARKPEDRYQTPAELATALRELLPATERTQSPFESTRRAGDIAALLEQQKRPRAPVELALTERAVEQPEAPLAAPAASPHRPSTPAPAQHSSQAASAHDATLLSASSDPPPALGPRSKRATWLPLVAVLLLLVAGGVAWRLRTPAPVDSPAQAVQGADDKPAASPAAQLAASAGSEIRLAPPPSGAPLPSATAASTSAAPQRVPAAAKSAQPNTRAGQHALEQENPFR